MRVLHIDSLASTQGRKSLSGYKRRHTIESNRNTPAKLAGQVAGRSTGNWLWWLLVLLTLAGCSTTYRFQYHYTMVSPPGGTEGVESDEARIQVTPEPGTGVIQLTVTNKSSRSMVIVWDQTYFVDPFGRRRQATETGAQWFFRFREWFANDTRIAAGETLRLRLQPGSHQTYNPFTVTRAEGGGATLSTSPRPLLPARGNIQSVGKRYQGREFRLVLALQTGSHIVQYPFTFRITDVAVQSP